MKKIGKKIVALVMAMVMTLAMCTSVFADGTTSTISVTVKMNIVAKDGASAVYAVKTVNVTPGTVEAIVKEALPQLEIGVTNEEGETVWQNYGITRGNWVTVPDWQNSEITYQALDGLYFGNTLKYVGEDYESETAWYGYGWTYDGKNGSTALDTSKYMSQNTINQNNSEINLSYAYYNYSK